jgi:hypothetical protein
MYPYLSREEFRANMIVQPTEGWENPPLPTGGTLLSPAKNKEKTME